MHRNRVGTIEKRIKIDISRWSSHGTDPIEVYPSLWEAGSLMTELKNGPSWPETRDEVFKICLGQYCPLLYLVFPGVLIFENLASMQYFK